MNNRIEIKIEAPIVRPGITITSSCSEKYAVAVTKKLMEIAREFNT